MASTAGERRARAKRNLVFLIILLVALGAAFFVWQHYENTQQVEQRGTLPEGFGQRKRVTYEGKTYAEKPAMTTILMMGVDKTSEDTGIGARSGGQADFLLLLVIDHQHSTIYQLQLDRDTMTPVGVLGILGNYVGTRTLQISLSHGFGLTEEDCCQNTVDAASNLLEGLTIDYYVSLDMDSMSLVNNLLGGVTVTFDQDYSDIDPAMTEGATLTLTDDQAERFLHARMSVGEGTNEERMARHRLYLNAASDVIRRKTADSLDFINTFYEGMSGHMTTNMTLSRLLTEVNEAYNYETMPIETLAGEHVIGEDGFMQFYVADGEAARWVMNTCFEPVD